MREIIIIGSGPAGLTAAIYTARASLQPLLIGGLSYGGQLMNTTEVENFPGFPEGVMGPELMQKFIDQAKRFGAEMIMKDATKIDMRGKTKRVWIGDEVYESKAVIIATGAEPRKLGLTSEGKYWGKGVSSCATCDGAFFRGVEVAVVGGGDSAVEESMFLTRFASKVHLIVRKDFLRASKIMQARLTENPKVEIHWQSEIQEILGDESRVTGIRIVNNQTQKEDTVALNALFLAIGHIPNVNLVKDELSQDDLGYLETQAGTTFTNIDGVFVAGDVKDHRYRQAITAAGMGCMAAIDAERWLESV